MTTNTTPDTLPDDGELPNPAHIAVQPTEAHITPYDHQRRAWDDMDRFFLRDRKQAGFIVVPTGGGKTFIAAHWLLHNHLAKGGRVLWLTHRIELLRQARQTFAEHAGLLAGTRDRLSLALVGGQGIRWSSVSAHLDIVLAMFQSSCQPGAEEHLRLLLDQSPNGLMVVVDEAHHAVARTWLRLMRSLKERGLPIIGLTATPMRVNEDDAKRLHTIFDHQVITRVRKQELIERGILARPNPISVETKVSIEGEFTDGAVELINRFGDLSKDVLERLGRSSSRNRLIVQEYVAKHEMYGKTLVFAIDTLHARTLNDEFARAGISADFIDYTKPDRSVIDRYRTSDDPEVLINVDMLTEGFDAPCTRTVFITRPTASEILVQQMVGRALRGPAANGNPVAHLVTFADTWRIFSPIEPNILIHAESLTDEAPDVTSAQKSRITIEEELVLAAYQLLRDRFMGETMRRFSCVPAAWYSWTDDDAEQVEQRRVLVLDHQSAGFTTMAAAFAAGELQVPAIGEPISVMFAEGVLDRFFADSADPLPNPYDIRDLLDAWRRKVDVSSATFAEREAFNPRNLASAYIGEGINDKEQVERLSQLLEANPVCSAAYEGRIDLLLQEVNQAKEILLRPRSKPKVALAHDARKPLPAPWPAGAPGYDLQAIYNRVCASSRHFSKGAPPIAGIRFSRRPLVRLWGQMHYERNQIMLNSVLNSPQVPVVVIEFLVYHEALHADMPHAGHNRDFRAREARFTPSTEAVEEVAHHTDVFAVRSTASWASRCDQYLDTFHHIHADIEDHGNAY